MVMAKIRADKDEIELKSLREEHSALEIKVMSLRKEIERQEADWRFQQLAQSQGVHPEEEDNDY